MVKESQLGSVADQLDCYGMGKINTILSFFIHL